MTELTTPNFGVRYPTSASTGPQFATGIADMATDLDGLVRLKSRVMTTSQTAASGDLVNANGVGITVTLPAPASNAMVCVWNSGGSGANPTVVSGTNIYGVGLSGVASFKLGALGAFAVLQSDGASWLMTAGQQDTGWVALTLVNNWTTLAGYSTPAYRLAGDRVTLRGGLNGLSATNATVATLPAGVRPPATVGWIGGVGASPVGLTAAGVLTCASFPVTVAIDGSSFGL